MSRAPLPKLQLYKERMGWTLTMTFMLRWTNPCTDRIQLLDQG
ncbi:DUF899 domain-containing protein [Fictibacillus sp. WQ 8-8]|nr:DUF899 family protein [Fictibacillus sp. WQ 8-8]MCQ6266781.1 DUF899 domain-containing protein [Fictibacillus sp. WQ 8-8]